MSARARRPRPVVDAAMKRWIDEQLSHFPDDWIHGVVTDIRQCERANISARQREVQLDGAA